MNRLIQLAAVALLGLPAAAYAQSCTPISTIPVTITKPGTYCLAADAQVNMASGVGISIASHDVTLDCDGHQLRNIATAATGNAAAIQFVNRHNIVVKECRVIGGWNIGIDGFQDNTKANANYYVQIQDNYVAGPLWHGIRAYGSAVEVTNNTIYDIGGKQGQYAIGIRVGGSKLGFQTQVVRGNTVIGTNSPYSVAYGIFSDASVGSAFVENGITGTSGASGQKVYGMYIIGQHNRISDNHVAGVGAPMESAIFSTDATTSCFDNYLRTTAWTVNCDAGLGNF